MPTETQPSNTEKSLTFTESSLAAALENVQALHEMGCELIAGVVFQQIPEQHQGEPVAWLYKGTIGGDILRDSRLDHYFVPIGGDGNEYVKGVPLYAQADSGEVERLRTEIRSLRQHKTDYMEAAEETRKALLAQLAEREALCKRLAYHLGPALAANQGSMSDECIHDAHAAIHEWTQIALASAEPSAPVEQHGTSSDKYKAELYDEVFELARGLGYMNVTTAVSTLRAERDQLQADLTVRDELIDQLRSGFVFETGAYQVELPEEHWLRVFSIFDNYTQGNEDTFVCPQDNLRGLVSEILIELGLARAPDSD